MPRILYDRNALSQKKANFTVFAPKVRCKAFAPAASIVLLAALACRPVLTIGWGEMFFIVGLLLIVIGPPLYRLFRRLEDSHHHEREKEEEGKKSD